MFPHVNAQNGGACLLHATCHQRVVLVGGARHHKAPLVGQRQPRPTASKLLGGRRREFLNHGLGGTEVAVDQFLRAGCRRVASSRLQHLPVQAVVEMSSSVVPHCIFFRTHLTQQPFQGAVAHHRRACKRRVQLAHVACVMLAMVQRHRFCVDGRGQRVQGKSKFGQGKRRIAPNRGGRLWALSVATADPRGHQHTGTCNS